MPALKKSLFLFGSVLIASAVTLVAQLASPAPTAAPESSPPAGFTLSPAATPAEVAPAVPAPMDAPAPTPAAPSAGDVPLPEPAASPSGSNDSLFLQPPNANPAPGASTVPDLLPGTAGGAQPVIRKSTTSSSLAELQAKIHLRQAMTRATNEPALQQQLAYANGQPTLPEYREEMLKYYQLLQDHEIAIDPTVKDLATAAFSLQTQLIGQRRVRSTSAAEIRTARGAHSTSR